jgi:hypothetical protein
MSHNVRLRSNNYNSGSRKPLQNPMPIKIGLPPYKMNETMNVPMPKHYELQQRQLAQPLDNYHMSNQSLFKTKRNLMAVG